MDLKRNKQNYRGVPRSFDGQMDYGQHKLHSIRFEADPHVNPADPYKLGLAYHCTTKPPPFFHDLSHLESGLMIDG